MQAKVSLPLVVSVLLLSVIAQKWYLALFAAPLLLPVVAGLRSRYELAQSVKVRRVVPTWRVPLGRELPVTLIVENTSPRTLVVEVEDGIPHGLVVSEGVPRRTVVLKPYGSTQLSYKIRALVRGRFEVGPIAVRVWDEFLTLPALRTVSDNVNIIVIPPVRRLLWLPSKRSITLPGFGDFPSRRSGEGFEFMEVSEALGGSTRRVNWKATAKFEKLMVNLFSEERSASILIVLEVPGKRLLGTRTDILLEELVAAAASIVAYLHRRGHRISLLVVGRYRDWVQPGFGKSQFLRLLTSLACVRALPYKQFVDHRDIVAKVVPFLSPTGSLVIVISSFVDTQGGAVAKELEALGFHVIYVAVNPFTHIGGEASEKLAKAWMRGVMKRLTGRSTWLWMGARGDKGLAVVRQIV